MNSTSKTYTADRTTNGYSIDRGCRQESGSTKSLRSEAYLSRFKTDAGKIYQYNHFDVYSNDDVNRTGYSLKVKEDSLDFVDAHFGGEGYRVTRDRLIALLLEDDEDEPKPTSYAFNNAWEIITATAKKINLDFPKASVSADDEGGIRLRWRNSRKNLEASLYCPSSDSEKAYIYYEADDKYGLDYKVELNLYEWLTWLINN